MLFEDLLEYLGALPLLLAILPAFWVGDEALSPAFRADVSRWLRGLGPRRDVSIGADNPVPMVVLGLFQRVFGHHAASPRFLLRSAAVSAVATLGLIFGLDAINAALGRPALRIADNADFTTALTILVATNIVADYVSLRQSRYVLAKMGVGATHDVLLVLLDLVLTSAVFVVTLFGVASIAATMTDDWVPTSFVRFGTGLMEILLEAFDGRGEYWFLGLHVTQTSTVILIPLITTFLTSAWIWAAALGAAGIRLLSAGGPVLRALLYALPVDDKPVRSIGVAATLVVLAAMLLGETAAALVP